MKVRVLGCSGGLGGAHLRTTSLLVDDDILIDAGTGVGDLSLEDLVKIDHVFVTHSHMDHIACLPLLVDAVWELRSRPVTVHASAATLEILKAHIFNWAVWPDFTLLPDAQRPALVFESLAVGQKINLAGRSITALPANHTVPAVGYLLENGQGSLAFTGDTASCDALWKALNAVPKLDFLLTEAAFPDSASRLVHCSKHLSPALLARELAQLQHQPEVWVSHLKPGRASETRRDLEALPIKLNILQMGQVFEI